MAQPPLRKIKPGERITGIVAETWNAFVDAAIDTKKRNRQIAVDELRKISQSGIVLSRNDTTAKVPRFGILGIDRTIILPTSNPDEFKRQVAVRCVKPADKHAVRFVVMLEPTDPQRISPAVASGVVQCRIFVKVETDQFAQAKKDETKYLESSGSGVPILWKESGVSAAGDDATLKWAIIRLDAMGSGGGNFYFKIQKVNCTLKMAEVLVTHVPCGTSDPALNAIITILDVLCYLTGNEQLLVGRKGVGQKSDGDFSTFTGCPAWESAGAGCQNHSTGCQFTISNLCPLLESCT